MKLIAITLICATLAGAQSLTLTLSGVSAANLLDARTHWIDQASAVAGSTTLDMDATTATVTVTLTRTAAQQLFPIPIVGQSVVIGGEPMACSGVNGLTLTLQRGTLPMTSTLMAVHTAGTPVLILKYANPWDVLNNEAIRVWMARIAAQLGSRSATFAGVATGTLNQ